LEQAYGFEFARDRVVRMDIDLIYQVLRNLDFIDVGLVFATDGRIPAYDLLVLKDDREFFPTIRWRRSSDGRAFSSTRSLRFTWKG
jgi:osmoprotectant transport system substrate-binding protein